MRAALIAAALLFVGSSAAADKPMPTDLYGDPAHPNLSGWWAKDMPRYQDMTPAPEQTPPYAAFRDKVQKGLEVGKPLADHSSRCQGFGLPWFMSLGFELQQTPGRITMITEPMHEVRRIYTDGRGHPSDLDLTFEGHSVGHWDGDTLVVETVALRPAYIDASGYSHSGKMTVVERFHRASVRELDVDMTLTDPEALVKPWTGRLKYALVDPKEEMLEYICTDNVRNRANDDGTLGVQTDEAAPQP